jgi:aldoxime dehydratase
MGAEHQANPRDGVPEDYPGRVVSFPGHVSHLVFGIYGIQSGDPRETKPYVEALAALVKLPGGPNHVERGHHVDKQGFHNDVFMAYWIDPPRAASWWGGGAVSQWWSELPVDRSSDLGFWHETLVTPKDQFHYAAGVEDKAASAALLPLVPSKTFGYWGAYRDRTPASRHDDFKSPVYKLNPPIEHETKGKRLRVSIPDNVCVIREGQGWGNCGPEEMRIWKEQMAGPVGRWVDFLGSDPVTTGCMSIRHCDERDTESGLPNSRQSQLAFLLSLGHIEKAARTQQVHLNVRDAFISMYTEPKFTPRMHIWVELHIVKHDQLQVEYVNCHPKTGLLPFFEPLEPA